ncbi:hypothetical protein LOZ57_002594 [Ophidiomyces ophidiicola]|uniref:uncharacterized protein n=1 Tax=Ophidiomyces ophidiicola TaxID=1387563 RepID=UPI0020C39BA2|nr:uncharacterized protein LOZ57_002594 [Ophidiomyces ophidiicola]KAI1949222.1 hypothetical protein LOZ57_002594 [Ophidiomyces ophidiicola]KAI2051822.1 hypothetical protein LOZ43_004645 [Ophidiomyces ophidiicola]KAI2091364.1 hypothetical protein LOZ36_001015 [Ophidiomyces ophidiicola]
MSAAERKFPGLHIVEPQTTHTHTAILLHGRGSNGPEFAEDIFSSETSMGKNLESHFPSWKWVFPSSGERWSTIFQEDLSSWFDIYSLTEPDDRQDLQLQGLRESCFHVLDVLEQEINLLDGKSENIVFGGISQGMATALWTLLCSPVRVKSRLGGFVGFCGWMPFTQHIEEATQKYRSQHGFDDRGKCVNIPATLVEVMGCEQFEQNTDEVDALLSTPILLIHGIDDAMVDISLGRQACRLLEGIGMEAELKEFSGAENEGHWIKAPQGFDKIVAFLKTNTG